MFAWLGRFVALCFLLWCLKWFVVAAAVLAVLVD